MVSTPSLFLGVLRSETCSKPSFLAYHYCVIVPIGKVHSSTLLLLDEGLNFALCWQDAFPMNVVSENRFQRTATLLLYLNDVAEVLLLL